jgi:hypothetical protein
MNPIRREKPPHSAQVLERWAREWADAERVPVARVQRSVSYMVNTALVQIDPDTAVTAHATLLVNGAARASSDAAASGDTRFNFPAVGVAGGDQVTLSISFTASSGKIITVYTRVARAARSRPPTRARTTRRASR